VYDRVVGLRDEEEGWPMNVLRKTSDGGPCA
jgi:hypothetical protein